MRNSVVLRGNYWKAVLGEIKDSIIFIDEENMYVKSTEFARAISESDNYYVIVTRENLKSGLIDGKTIQSILEQPEEHIDSREYFSWERYFYWLLKEWSKDTYLKYSKGSLNENYLNDKEKAAILRVMEGVLIEKN